MTTKGLAYRHFVYVDVIDTRKIYVNDICLSGYLPSSKRKY